jgi:hypothetical protein
MDIGTVRRSSGYVSSGSNKIKKKSEGKRKKKKHICAPDISFEPSCLLQNFEEVFHFENSILGEISTVNSVLDLPRIQEKEKKQ